MQCPLSCKVLRYLRIHASTYDRARTAGQAKQAEAEAHCSGLLAIVNLCGLVVASLLELAVVVDEERGLGDVALNGLGVELEEARHDLDARLVRRVRLENLLEVALRVLDHADAERHLAQVEVGAPVAGLDRQNRFERVERLVELVAALVSDASEEEHLNVVRLRLEHAARVRLGNGQLARARERDRQEPALALDAILNVALQTLEQLLEILSCTRPYEGFS
mmetsp:Transcript_27361/g.57562  ORF Transcript_27361/g.57562 Transcript_27361/m.57562 type:complete len:222 (-) Transcript_27361:289-954(-)